MVVCRFSQLYLILGIIKHLPPLSRYSKLLVTASCEYEKGQGHSTSHYCPGYSDAKVTPYEGIKTEKLAKMAEVFCSHCTSEDFICKQLFCLPDILMVNITQTVLASFCETIQTDFPACHSEFCTSPLSRRGIRGSDMNYPSSSNLNGQFSCQASLPWAGVAGMNAWCESNCVNGYDGVTCTEQYCDCSMSQTTTTASVVGNQPTVVCTEWEANPTYAGTAGIDEWCQSMCSSGSCPLSHCQCKAGLTLTSKTTSSQTTTARPTTVSSPMTTARTTSTSLPTSTERITISSPMTTARQTTSTSRTTERTTTLLPTSTERTSTTTRTKTSTTGTKTSTTRTTTAPTNTTTRITPPIMTTGITTITGTTTMPTTTTTPNTSTTTSGTITTSKSPSGTAASSTTRTTTTTAGATTTPTTTSGTSTTVSTPRTTNTGTTSTTTTGTTTQTADATAQTTTTGTPARARGTTTTSTTGTTTTPTAYAGATTQTTDAGEITTTTLTTDTGTTTPTTDTGETVKPTITTGTMSSPRTTERTMTTTSSPTTAVRTTKTPQLTSSSISLTTTGKTSRTTTLDTNTTTIRRTETTPRTTTRTTVSHTTSDSSITTTSESSTTLSGSVTVSAPVSTSASMAHNITDEDSFIIVDQIVCDHATFQGQNMVTARFCHREGQGQNKDAFKMEESEILLCGQQVKGAEVVFEDNNTLIFGESCSVNKGFKASVQVIDPSKPVQCSQAYLAAGDKMGFSKDIIDQVFSFAPKILCSLTDGSARTDTCANMFCGESPLSQRVIRTAMCSVCQLFIADGYTDCLNTYC